MDEPKEIPKAPNAKEINRGHLQKTMSYYLRNLDDGRLPRDENGALNILSVGCWYGYEAKPIIDIFPNSKYKGIDIRKERIQGARDANRDLSSEAVSFTVEDARSLDEGEREKYGLVTLRHPQVRGDQEGKDPENTVEAWKQIFASSVQKLVPGGYIFVTVDDPKEKYLVVEHLRENNIEVLLVQENLASDTNQRGLIHSDSIIIIGHKGVEREDSLGVK